MGGEAGNCITLHQPWASLLVHGIKRIEGRSWPSPIRGRLWIHAASKVPDLATIEAMEEFYREVYAVDGVTEIVFPKHYPVSVLLGCVDVVGCLRKEELVNWEDIPTGVRLEAQTDFCWLCEDPQKLVVPLEMRGRQGVYQLQKKILGVAPRALRGSAGPAPVTFPTLDSLDPSSLRPGRLQRDLNAAEELPIKSSLPKLDAAIAGAQVAALQFRKQDDRVNLPGSTGHSVGQRSSSGPADLDKLSFQFGQKAAIHSNLEKREKERTLHGEGRDGRSLGSTSVNASRQAPRRVAAFRIFDQAVGALNQKSSV